MTTCIQVFTTIDSSARARQLASVATNSRLAACAQISGPIQSTYWWKDKLETGEEWQVAFKTTESAYADLEGLLKKHHPYEVPEILAIPIVHGNIDYLNWIVEQVKPAADQGSA